MVHLDHGRWRARVIRNGKILYSTTWEKKEDAIAAREAFVSTLPDRGVKGRSWRRYTAPPGYRACANPDCMHGYDKDGNRSRSVLPESEFPSSGKYRRSICPACQREDQRERSKRRYQKNPEAERLRRREAYRKRARERTYERNSNREVMLRVLSHLKSRGWTQEMIGAEIGVTKHAVSKWKLGHSRFPRGDGWNRLMRLYAREKMKGDRIIDRPGAVHAPD